MIIPEVPMRKITSLLLALLMLCCPALADPGSYHSGGYHPGSYRSGSHHPRACCPDNAQSYSSRHNPGSRSQQNAHG